MKWVAGTLALCAAGLAAGAQAADAKPEIPSPAGIATGAPAAPPAAAVPAAGPADVALATPAPVAGTLDFQLARMSAPASVAAAPVVPVQADAGSARLSHRVIDAAGAFDTYMGRASALDGRFKDGAAVISAMHLGAGYEASQLQEGAVAYGALAALQDAAFVEAVRAAAPTPDARDALAERLLAEPASVLRLQGSHETAARVAAIVGARGAALATAGETVRKASYSVQKEAWAKAPLSHADVDLKEIKALSSARSSLSEAETVALMGAMVKLRGGAMQSAVEPGLRPTPATAQALALAALAVLGRAGEERGEDVARLLSTEQGADCLKLAKLNLYQCMAVAGPHYEDLFCLGRHGMADTGQCVVSTAGWSGDPSQAATPVLVAAAAAPLAPPVSASVAVPLASMSADGPERSGVYAVAAPAAAASAVPVESVARADLPAYRAVASSSRLDRDEDGYTARGRRSDDAGPAPRRRDASAYGARQAYDDASYGVRPPPPAYPPAYARARYDRYGYDYAPHTYAARQDDRLRDGDPAFSSQTARDDDAYDSAIDDVPQDR